MDPSIRQRKYFPMGSVRTQPSHPILSQSHRPRQRDLERVRDAVDSQQAQVSRLTEQVGKLRGGKNHQNLVPGTRPGSIEKPVQLVLGSGDTDPGVQHGWFF